ncbi:MAG TPA: archease [Spirochaetota bacterium]|nr:archease [Spirochaetota bacterium]HPI91254.1 archease [Spirochaetota bacterium]HPR50107.1 archease [Spirochaetota bacterium]
MSFEIIEGLTMADIAFIARGASLNELFVSGAEALFHIMLQDPSSIKKKETVSFHLDSAVPDLLYYAFLSEFLFYKDARGLLLVPETVDVVEKQGHWFCSCEGSGEMIGPHHVFNTDIKAVTMHGLEVKQENGLWSARAVLDV